MVAVSKIMPNSKMFQNLLYFLPKERPWMTNSVIKMTLPCFIWLSRLGNVSIFSEKCVKSDDNKLVYSDTAAKKKLETTLPMPA